jgi:arylesterase/paraoxonase
VFVIEHQEPALLGGTDHRMGIYEVAPSQLTHLRTVMGLSSPNDVVAVGPESFYVTEDHGVVTGFLRMAQEVLVLPGGGVDYFDGNALRRVASDMYYANGIAMIGDELVVSQILRRDLVRFRVEQTGDLTRIGSLSLGTAPDNLWVDSHETLWIGAHPRPLRFSRHATSNAPAPAQVLTVTGDVVSTVFQDDGTLVSASSAAVIAGDRMLIGAVFDPFFLDCPAPD